MKDFLALPNISGQKIHSTYKIQHLKDNIYKEKEVEKLKGLCSEFESIFIYNMLRAMRSTIPKSSLLSESKSEEFYTAMFDQQLARMAALRGEMGISSLLSKQFKSDLTYDK